MLQRTFRIVHFRHAGTGFLIHAAMAPRNGSLSQISQCRRCFTIATTTTQQYEGSLLIVQISRNGLQERRFARPVGTQ